MSFFVSEIVTPPAHLPITVAAADQALSAAVVEEIERGVLWRAIVRQERRIVLDGPLPPRIELEPVVSLTITRWSPTDAAEVIDADGYDFVSRDPAGCIIQPTSSWPQPQRPLSSFAITYTCGWEVSPESSPGAGDEINNVPASIQLLVSRAVRFRAGSGVGDLTIGSLTIGLADSYKTDALPREITNIGRGFQYRPGLFSARP